MLTKILCECGNEIEVSAEESGSKLRCPRCWRKVFLHESEANADFDKQSQDPDPSSVDTAVLLTETPPVGGGAFVNNANDPDATLAITGAEKREQSVQNDATRVIDKNTASTKDTADDNFQTDTPPSFSKPKSSPYPDIPAAYKPKEPPRNQAANPFAHQSPPPQNPSSSGIPRGSKINLTDRVMRPINKPSVHSDAAQSPGNYGIHRAIRVHQKGGMGRILVAYDQHLKREVALKELHPEVAGDESIVRRFVGEAEITAQLEHPGVVPIHYLGSDRDGLPYYTMKMIRGETLQEAIKAYHRKPSRAALLQLVRRLISASKTIAFAHSKGVIHRDLKPANIMIGEHGETLVMDWGLAKPIQQPDQESYVSYIHRSQGIRPELTMVGAIVGTPAFMSPEQASADEAVIGPLSDVFALGTILYYLLAGQTAFSGCSTQEVLNKVRAANPVKPSNIKPNVSFGLEAICFKAMAKEPINRYQGAEEFVADLCRWLDNEPILAVKESVFQRCSRWLVKHKTLAVSVPFAAILTTILIYAGVQIGYHSIMSRENAAINAVLNQQADLLEHQDLVFIEASPGIDIRREIRQTGGTLLSCKIEDELDDPHRVIIIHAPERCSWDLSARSIFAFLLSESHSSGTDALTNFYVRFGCGSAYFEYRPSHYLWDNHSRNSWYPFSIPLSVPNNDWTQTSSGNPSMNKIEWIEFHFDAHASTSVSFNNVVFLNDLVF
ncbi:hypothetical protein FACS189419_06110 [Planctomycetales bacterium]|nr:hypothetical protein FACS189419_06110 [Planctomycetales bacterium]